MLYYLTAAGLIAHTYFWGLGLAALALPRVWRRWWVCFAPGFGLGLESGVVWGGAHTGVAGTEAYARWSELLPLALIILAHRRRAIPLPRGWLGVLAVLLVAGWMLVSPMTKPGRGLTASSLGSCDHADYAAGARGFQEFSRDDRTGFLGLPEVTKVRSADYFFDFWLRLNHFTPSALLAHNAAVFGVESYRLVSITGAVLVLLNLPLVLFLARVTVGVRGRWLIGLVALYVLSPINAYAVHHGMLGQLYAAQGIALLTLAAFGASRAAHSGRSTWPFLPLVLAAFWLLAGSYNFILLVCLAPAGAWLLAQLWSRRNMPAILRVLAVLVTGLALCAGLFWGRFAGLIERFSLFKQYNEGWAVPLFSPEGWLGLLEDTGLNAAPVPARVALSFGVVGLWLAGVAALWQRQKPRGFAALALVLPVVFGWSLLAWEARVRANASYDAYKLISVFYPGLLAGLACWLAAAQHCHRSVQRAASVVLTIILAANVLLAGEFRRQMAAPPLRVDRSLVELGRLEQDDRITSLNMVVEDYWSRLWANAFLLRKAQYFAIHTYEGRLNTALRGEWNLSDSVLHLAPLRAEDFRRINERYHLVRAAAPGLLQANFAEGWYAEERSGSSRWRWSGGQGRILVTNPTASPVRAELRLRVRAIAPRELTLRLEQHVIGRQPLNGSLQEVLYANMLLQPGVTVLSLTSEAPAAGPGARDARTPAFTLYDFDLRTLY